MKKTPERKHLFSFDQNVGFNKKYTTIALYAVFVLIFGVICVYFLINNDKYAVVFDTVEGIVFPIFTGLVIAYILNPIMKLFEEKVFISSEQRKVNKLRRKLFRTKLAYDHLVKVSDEQSQAPASALKVLTDTRIELEAAYTAVQKKEALRRSKLLKKASKKKTKPSFRPSSDHSPKIAHPYRGFSLLFTYLIFLAVVSLICWIVIPQCIESVAGLLTKITKLLNTLPTELEAFVKRNELARSLYNYVREYVANDVDIKSGIIDTLTSSISGLSSYLTELISALPVYILSAFSSITNIILALFFSVYFLSSKEMLKRQAHRLGKAFLSPKLYKGTCHVIKEIDRKFGQFIEGKILDSTIIGILALIVLWIIKMPYYQMLALIIGVTNIIPFFGPIIGGVIGSAIMLIADPAKVIPFIIVVLIIQQLDGNVIGPLILGDSLGLQPVWIMIAIVIMSGLFGFFGMLFGVPLFAVIYTLIREAVDKRLANKRQTVDLTSVQVSDSQSED